MSKNHTHPATVNIAITITEQPRYEDDGYYLGECDILGVPHHIELWEIEPGLNVQEIVSPTRDEQFEKLIDFSGTYHNFGEIEVDGRCYVCAITPHS